MNLLKFFGLVLLLGLNAQASQTNSEFVASCGQDYSRIRAREIDPKAQLVLDLFQAKCTTCHQAGHSAGPFIDILDVVELKQKGIIGGQADQTRLYNSLNRASNWMPLGSPTPLPLDQKKIILDWLEAGAPPLSNQQPPQPQKYPQVYYGDLAACIFNDLNHAGQKGSPIKVADRKDQRYVSLVELLDPVDVDRAQYAVSKLINSVSFQQTIYKARKVDKFGLVYAINLEDYNLNARDWDNLVQNGKYPYGVKFFEDDEFEVFEDGIAKLTETDRNKTIAFVRADWFVFTLSQPPFYYDFLRLPNSQAAFEKLLNVDKSRQFADEEILREAVRHSGVTLANRVIDRFELVYTAGPKRDFWITYDTKGEDGRRNLFDFVFSPFDLKFTGVKSDKVFQFDANETIFGLPNGLSGYFLADGRGLRIDAADTAIAYDRANIGQHLGKVPGEIINGVSCMGCHAGGMNVFTGDFRTYALDSPGFSNAEANVLDPAVFVSDAQLKTKLTGYSDIFGVSNVATGINKVKLTTQEDEPIYNTARYYADYVEPCQLGQELWLSCDETKRKLIRAADLSRRLGFGANASGHASRRNVELLFPEILKEFDLGDSINFKKKIEPPVKPPEKPPVKPEPPVKPKPPCDGYGILNLSANSVRLNIYDWNTKEDIIKGTLIMQSKDSQTYKWAQTEIHAVVGRKSYKLLRCQNYVVKDVAGEQEFFTLTE